MAERRIVEGTGAGVVCLISNYSWLDGLSFTAMRERYLDVFDHIWIDNLNGDKYKTGKVTPEGLPDPSVFSTEYNREGIQVGTAVALMVRRQTHTAAGSVDYREFLGPRQAGGTGSERHDAGCRAAYRHIDTADCAWLAVHAGANRRRIRMSMAALA